MRQSMMLLSSFKLFHHHASECSVHTTSICGVERIPFERATVLVKRLMLMLPLLRTRDDARYDVYMGIDTFGRGTWGGGGFDVDKALGKIRRAGVSAALFAPAWTMEDATTGIFVYCYL